MLFNKKKCLNLKTLKKTINKSIKSQLRQSYGIVSNDNYNTKI